MNVTARVGVMVLATSVLAAVGIAAASTGEAAAGARHPALGARTARPRSVSPGPASQPKGYAIVDSAFTAGGGTQTTGSVTCPANTVVYGGGDAANGGLGTNLGSSHPTSDGVWAVAINNRIPGPEGFDVWAVCAHMPKGYTQVASRVVDDPAASQAQAVATCPAGLKVLGGGGSSNSISTMVNMNTSIPKFLPNSKRYAWQVNMNNATADEIAFRAWAVCGKVPGFALQKGSVVANGAGSATEATVACPLGTVPLGGGVRSNSTSTAVNIFSTWPYAGGWLTLENNADSVDHTARAFVTCAT